MKCVLLISLLTALTLSTGCTYWYKPSASFDQAEADLYDCGCQMRMRADRTLPTFYEIDFVKDCMKEKGYESYFDHQLPNDAKREDPHLQTFWIYRGVAGKIQ